MIASESTCLSDNVDLGYFFDVNDCAKVALENYYQFFIHDMSDGECLAETTTSRDCSEGLSYSSYYNFYEVSGLLIDPEHAEEP
jgi:hypothetical protein